MNLFVIEQQSSCLQIKHLVLTGVKHLLKTGQPIT